MILMQFCKHNTDCTSQQAFLHRCLLLAESYPKSAAILTNMQPADQKFAIIAHRGFSSRAPENTIGSFDLAWKAGFPSMEMDVQLTSDGAPVVLKLQSRAFRCHLL